MKQRIFTLVMMLALVIVTGSAFAQTKTAPFEGTTYTYTVTGLAIGDSVTVSLTPAGSTDAATGAIAPNGTPGNGEWYIDNVKRPKLLAAGSSAFDITWGSDAGGNAYKLWISVINTTTSTCSNYRYIPINPVANTFNVAVYAVGSGDASATGLTLATDNAAASECLTPAQIIGENYLATSAADGTTYVYYRVQRLAPTTSDYAWSFTFAAAGLTGTTSYSADGSTWGATSFAADEAIPNTDNEVYVRVLIDVPLTTNASANAAISNMKLGTFSNTLVSDQTAGDNTDSYTIQARPAIGGFN